MWDHDTNVQGLIRNRRSGRYHASFRVRVKQTMKALKTKVWSVVKLRLVNELANPEQQRSQNKRVSETVDIRVGDLLLKKDACYHSTNRFDSPETSLRTILAILRPTVCFFLALSYLFKNPKKLQLMWSCRSRILYDKGGSEGPEQRC